MKVYKVFTEVKKSFLLSNALPNRKLASKFWAVLNHIHFPQRLFVFRVKHTDKDRGSGREHTCYVQLSNDFDNLKTVNQLLSNGDVRVWCSCEDFRYRFAYKATRLSFHAIGFSEKRPARKTNPTHQGTVCKHLFYVLNNFYNLVRSGFEREKRRYYRSLKQ
ncbi:MAG: hypothetical protein RML35_00785 [Chloroherpetonaceae bacterium]|nr:hypothetical protein [Chloroherpetonaceae bacterium]